MTKETFEKASWINSRINEAKTEEYRLRKLYNSNKDEPLNSEEIEWLFQTAMSGNTFKQGCYQSDFKNL